ncbi:MAG: hypothetical protein HC892_17390 [Saprospiraceae bacterium]|nr:hypothetical protein [Saprospiraceae bacterium]
MNLSKVTILLEKVNALHKSIQLGGDAISRIERDLMLSYLRQLYELFHEPVETNTPSSNFEAEVVHKNIEQPKPKPEPIPTSVPPRVIEITDFLKEELERPVKTPTPEPPYQPQPPRTYQEAPPKEIPKVAPITDLVTDNAIAALFDQKQAKELSERLSSIRIEDLTKAIALNDKLLYANDLFSGELVTFNEVVRTINNMNVFAEAQRYLTQLAKQHNWTSESKQESAQNFIKLVRRRFPN